MIPLVSLLLRSTAFYECQVSKLAAELSAQCQRRFRGIETFYGLAVSTYLDTRFKNLGFRDMANVESLKARLITEIQLLRQTSTSSVSAQARPPALPQQWLLQLPQAPLQGQLLPHLQQNILARFGHAST